MRRTNITAASLVLQANAQGVIDRIEARLALVRLGLLKVQK